jgi:hypothetical protein
MDRKKEKGLEMSETERGSDRKKEKAPGDVRNRSGFGQEKRKGAWSCPKP